ncbi:MAG TPA: cupin domain-containing protein [Dehalococcoidia bacterium]|jgi:quercetin dioxygenase-like cupin family protein|nr:cupin domain-containing protein [Dehalococcoidia bacterium]
MHVVRTPDSAASPETQFFVGQVRVQPIVAPADGLDIVLVRFSAGARTFLHTHSVPQVLHCTEGRGILATRREQHLVEPGDIVYVAADEEHWHGATPDSHFVHLSIRPPGETTWTRVDPLA